MYKWNIRGIRALLALGHIKRRYKTQWTAAAVATAAVYLEACIVDEFVPHGSLDMPHIDHADWQVHSRRPTDDGDVRSQTCIDRCIVATRGWKWWGRRGSPRHFYILLHWSKIQKMIITIYFEKKKTIFRTISKISKCSTHTRFESVICLLTHYRIYLSITI